MRRAPLTLKDGHHLNFHIHSRDVHPNCTDACGKFDSPGRALTNEEYAAWVPHLGHYTKYHKHIPPQFQSLIPAIPLNDAYSGALPPHPLPDLRSLPEAMGSMSIRSLPGNSGSASSAGPKLLLVESPRICAGWSGLETAQTLITYDRYVMERNTPAHIKAAFRTAPAGMAYLERPDEDDHNPDLESYQIHDMASIISLWKFLSDYGSTRWSGQLHFWKQGGPFNG